VLSWTVEFYTRFLIHTVENKDLLLFLRHPREQLRSIVMSTSVCVCVSVHEDISETTRAIFTIFCACCLWTWLSPPTAGWRNPKGKGHFWGFSTHWQCILQHSIWNPYKNGWSCRDAVWDGEWAWPEEQCVTWAWRFPTRKGQLWGKTCPTSLTLYELLRIWPVHAAACTR